MTSQGYARCTSMRGRLVVYMISFLPKLCFHFHLFLAKHQKDWRRFYGLCILDLCASPRGQLESFDMG